MKKNARLMLKNRIFANPFSNGGTFIQMTNNL